MGTFVKVMLIEQVIDGDTVIFSASPLKTVDMFSMRSGAKATGDDTVRKTEAATDVLELFKKYLIDIKGAKDNDGTAIEKQEILDTAYFLPYVTEAATKWLERSMPKNFAPSAS